MHLKVKYKPVHISLILILSLYTLIILHRLGGAKVGVIDMKPYELRDIDSKAVLDLLKV